MRQKRTRAIMLGVCALACAAFGTAAVASVSASAGTVNGWGVGTNIEAVSDLGDGYTCISGVNANSIANETALDVTKPIVLDFWSDGRGDAGDGWSFIGIADTLALAQAADNEIFHSPGMDNYPFIHMHNAGWTWHVSEGNISGKINERLNNDYATSSYSDLDFFMPQQGEYVHMELYFGETADQGYFMMNGMVVGKPSATQSSFTNGDAFLFVNGWFANEWRIKVSQADKAKSISGSSHLFVLTNIDGTLAKANEDIVKVTFDTESHNYGMMNTTGGTTLNFTVDVQDPCYSVSAVRTCGFYNPNGTWIAAYGDDIIPLTSGANGKYTANVSDWTAVVLSMEMDESLHKISLESEGVKAWIKDGVNALAEGETATVTVEALSFAHKVDEISYQIGERAPVILEQTENGKYDISLPADVQKGENIVVTAKGSLKDAVAPSEATVNNSLNGWDSSAGAEKYGVITSEGTQQLFDVGDGSTFFALDNSGSVSSVDALDVTKPIYMDFVVKYIATPETTYWVMFTLHDCFETGVKLGAQVYGGYGQDYFDIPALARGKFCFSFPDANNVTSGWASGLGDQYDTTKLSQITNNCGNAWNFNEELKNYNSGDLAKLEVYFGTTKSEGYIKLNGVQIGTPNAVQGDFENGVAYMHVSTFCSAYFRVKLYQESSFDYTTQVSEHANVTVESDLTNVMAYDVIKFKVECNEGYSIKSIKANGVDLKAAEDGYFYYKCAFGGATLSVETGATIQVNFVTNGGSAVESLQTAVGAIIEAPVSTKLGYTLSWYRDETLTQAMDFTQAVTESVTLYAKWTPVSYSIVYYNGINKIRDLEINSYTIESNITLETYSKEGYTFEGWYTNPQCTGEAVTTIQPGTTGEIVLYAKMTEKKSGCGGTVASCAIVSFVTLLGAVALVRGKKKEQ